MKKISLILLSVFLLASCGVKETIVPVSPKTETNNVEIGNKPIITITGSEVQPIR